MKCSGRFANKRRIGEPHTSLESASDLAGSTTSLSSLQPTPQYAAHPDPAWMDRTEQLAPEPRPTRYGAHDVDLEDMGELSGRSSLARAHA